LQAAGAELWRPAPHKCPIDVRITSSVKVSVPTFHPSPARLPVDLPC
jgi:hypothetical protein